MTQELTGQLLAVYTDTVKYRIHLLAVYTDTL